MWVLANNTPFAAERSWVRDKDGSEVWLVAVKGTFDVHPDGTTTVADEQVEVCIAPKHRGDPSETSLLYDSDLYHKKLHTDVLVDGHAYSPNGKPARSVDVRLKLGRINKTVRVFGERTWERSFLGLKVSDAVPFLKMPITYERAFGGIDSEAEPSDPRNREYRNPVGAGFAVASEHLVGKPVPNVEDPVRLISSWKDRPNPAGFGAIAGHWQPRVKYAGTCDKAWERERQPLLPLDFNERYYQCAPEDQQTESFLRGDEVVEIENATPNGLLRFRLPKVAPGFLTRFRNSESESHRAELHTVTIEPDYPRVAITWHTRLPCHHKVLKLMGTIIFVKQRITARNDRLSPAT